jgi:tetratricopeptide (TPR) repeat protein
MFQKAIDMFDVAFRKMWWKPEIGQAYIWKSLAHQTLGQEDKALECLFASVAACDTRREPFYELGEYYCKRKQYDQAITWWLAALGVPFRAHGYLNNKDLYGWKIHDRLASAYFCVGDKSKARDEWHKAIQFDDCPPVVLQNIKQFYDCEKISIVVPTCRPEGFKRLKRSIEALTVYPDYEIIERPEAGTAIDKFNNGVEESNGDYIVFMADDTEATLGWLVKAYVHLQEKLRGRGCVIFNDGHWHGTLANHFLISKNMREELDGHIWYPGYFHNGVDCELYCRLEAKRLIGYCEYAKIIHYHHYSGTPGYEWDPADEWTAKVNETALRDRKLLVRRLYGLGLIEDAKRFEEWLKQYMASQK